MAFKILWYSIPALHDRSNGAAIHNKFLLEKLVERGFAVKVLNATCGDDPKFLGVFDNIAKSLNVPDTSNTLHFMDRGVDYFVARTQGKTEQTITAADQGLLFSLFIKLIEEFQPDVVVGYSGDFFSAFLRQEAAMRGIPSVYALCNGLHQNFAFANCDLIFTPSEATASMYKDIPSLNVKSVGQFIDPAVVIAENRNPQYVTFVNPGLHKGLAIVVKLMQIFEKERPDVKFLIVKSGGDIANNLRQLHYKDGSMLVTPEMINNNSFSIGNNYSIAEYTNDMRQVYALSKVVLMPSVWHEAWGCVATEAVMNGIPVLATTSGGLPQAIGEGGIVLDAPKSTAAEYACIPDDEEIAPYVEALKRLLDEDWTERCKQAAQINSVDSSIDRLLEVLTPVMEKGKANKRPFGKSMYFHEVYLQQEKKKVEAALAKASVQASQKAGHPTVNPSSNSSKKNRKPKSKKQK